MLYVHRNRRLIRDGSLKLQALVYNILLSRRKVPESDARSVREPRSAISTFTQFLSSDRHNARYKHIREKRKNLMMIVS